MKKLLLLAFALLASVLTAEIKAQNVQLFYDTGRNCATSTVEMFRPDAGGSTYFFVDLDYKPSMIGAYWEIARDFNFLQVLHYIQCVQRAIPFLCLARN